MLADHRVRLGQAIEKLLATRGDRGPVGEHDSLFVSGRLDSLAATELIVVLESEFGVDSSDPDFDVSQLDTLHDLQALVARATS